MRIVCKECGGNPPNMVYVRGAGKAATHAWEQRQYLVLHNYFLQKWFVHSLNEIARIVFDNFIVGIELR